jgi:hypothetical protein
VLETFMGVPLHPVLVHSVVIFVPMLALLALGYAFVPLFRPHTRWVIGILAVITPIAALLTKLAGDAFLRRMQNRNMVTPEFLPRLQEHQQLGTFLLYSAIVLGVVALAVVARIRPTSMSDGVATAGSSGGMAIVLRLLLLVAAGVALYYLFMAGDTGGKAVWEGY